MLLLHISSVYIFQVGVIQQLCGQACWTQGLHAGAAVKLHKVELDSWR